MRLNKFTQPSYNSLHTENPLNNLLVRCYGSAKKHIEFFESLGIDTDRFGDNMRKGHEYKTIQYCGLVHNKFNIDYASFSYNHQKIVTMSEIQGIVDDSILLSTEDMRNILNTLDGEWKRGIAKYEFSHSLALDIPFLITKERFGQYIKACNQEQLSNLSKLFPNYTTAKLITKPKTIINNIRWYEPKFHNEEFEDSLVFEAHINVRTTGSTNNGYTCINKYDNFIVKELCASSHAIKTVIYIGKNKDVLDFTSYSLYEFFKYCINNNKVTPRMTKELAQIGESDEALIGFQELIKGIVRESNLLKREDKFKPIPSMYINERGKSIFY